MKTNGVNNIDLDNWKDYPEVLTDSLWLFPKRGEGGGDNKFHGNFIPQIPEQLMLRYTKVGDWVIDPMIGSGTSAAVAKRLGRNICGIDLQQTAVDAAKHWFDTTKCSIEGVTPIGDFCQGSADLYNFEHLSDYQLCILHLPYHNTVKFSDNPEDLSNCKDVYEFIHRASIIVDDCACHLKNKGYLAIIMADIYENGKLHTVAHELTTLAPTYMTLKAMVVKDFGETQGKRGQHNLWRYRCLKNGTFVFKHEYIAIMRKEQ